MGLSTSGRDLMSCDAHVHEFSKSNQDGVALEGNSATFTGREEGC